MKIQTLVSLALVSFISLSANAEIKQGEHVMYSTSGRSSSLGEVNKVGTVVLAQGHNLIVQEINHSSKYGGIVYGASESGAVVKTYGLKQVYDSEVVKEAISATRADGTTVRPGSKINYRYGRGRTTHVGRVLYAFENGRVAIISEEDYTKYVAEGGAENGGDRIFNKEVVAVYLR